MTVERSLALYRRMLHLLPREFRNENGEEMERLFAEALVEARAKARGAVRRAWWWWAWDVAAAALLSRLAPRSRRVGNPSLRPAGRPGPIPRSPKPKDSLLLESLIADIWHTLRSLRKSPGFTAIVLLTLGLGVGATTLVFTVVT